MHEAADRAKIFAPFDALPGFREALAAKERIVVPKKELSEECRDELDRKLACIGPASVLTVTWYKDGTYLRKTGLVSKLNPDARTLRLVDETIHFSDICQLELHEC